MNIAIYHNDTKPSLHTAKELTQLINEMARLKIDNKNPNLVISVGGDGTLLSAFHHYLNDVDHVNFVGINTGHLGFYTDWLTKDLPVFLANIPTHGMENVSYPLLSVKVNFCGKAKPQTVTALNECMIKHSTSTMNADVYFKNTFIEHFLGDGLCVCTPTGSTGYNKSLGGPVVCPSLTEMIFTEDAPISNNSHHVLGSSASLPPNEPITIIPKDHTNNEIYYDGRCVKDLPVKSLKYTISKHRIRFASFRHIPFWRRVHSSFVAE